MYQQGSEKDQRRNVDKIDRLVEMGSHLGRWAVEVRDKGQQTDQEEVVDIRSASLSEEKVDSDSEVDQADQRQVKASQEVDLLSCQTVEIGDPFPQHGVTRIIPPLDPVAERQWTTGRDLIPRLVEIDLDVPGLFDYLEWCATRSTDPHQIVSWTNIGQRPWAAWFNQHGLNSQVSIPPDYTISRDLLLAEPVTKIEDAGTKGEQARK